MGARCGSSRWPREGLTGDVSSLSLYLGVEENVEEKGKEWLKKIVRKGRLICRRGHGEMLHGSVVLQRGGEGGLEGKEEKKKR